jgi:hypothetical protein
MRVEILITLLFPKDIIPYKEGLDDKKLLNFVINEKENRIDKNQHPKRDKKLYLKAALINHVFRIEI